MYRSGKPWLRLNLLLTTLLLVTGIATPAALAQDDAATEAAILVAAFTCAYDPGPVSVSSGTIPGDCTPTAGTWFSVTTDDGVFSGGCTSDVNGTCGVAVPDGSTVTVTEDTSLLAGVAPRENPITTPGVAGFAEVTFINVVTVTEAPTAAPTAIPTDVPAEIPTEVPTALPTDVPTVAPTVLPTLVPTAVPTAVPTGTPTEMPTVEPTAAPTGVPTEAPTLVPSAVASPTQAVNRTLQSPALQRDAPTPTPTVAPTPTKAPTPTPTPTPKPVTTTIGTVSNTGGLGLRCRTGPNTSSTIITVLPEGTRLEARGAASNGWLPVKCGGQDGWVSGTYITVSTTTTNPSPTTPPTSGTTTYGTVSNTGGLGLRCRTGPNTSSTIITVLPEGTRLQARGAASGGWLPVTCGGQDGWVSGTYITVSTSASNPKPTPTPTTAPTAPPASGTTTYWTVTGTGGAGLNCRTAPVSGSVITIFVEGARVEGRGDVANGWLPARCGGQNGWASTTYLTKSGSAGPAAPTPTPTTPSTGSSYATVSGTGGGGLNCRTAPVSGSVITTIPEMTRVEVIGSQQNGWVQVRCAGQTGWVSTAYLLFGVSTGGGGGEIWIDINLSTQYMVVYQGNNVLQKTYVSTGRPGFDTPTGTYYINWKLPSQTMSGVLGGEYYYVPEVPWVMYFTDRGHAIHGAYWHNNFGYTMSHGCVNLPLGFASWLYSVTPVGARVQIHY